MLRDLTRPDEMSTTDIQYTSLTLENVINSDVKVNGSASLDLLATYNNLMTTSLGLLQESQRNFHSIERMLSTLPDETLTQRRISVGVLSPTQIYGTHSTFHVSRSDSAAFHPGHAMTSESSEVFESVTTTPHADNKQKKTIINSLVMSASSEQSQIVNLPEPVIIMYRHKLQDIFGEGGDISEGHKKALNIISYIGCSISLTALLLTLVAYSISSMVMILFIVVTQPLIWSNTIACKATAGLLHYFLLSTWLWMAVEAFYMYLALIKIFKTYISRFILKSCLFGWGVPAVIVIITVSVSTDNYGQQGDICWLSRIPFYGACLAPIALILVANFVIFSMVIHQLRKLSARNDHRSMKQYNIQTQLRGAIAVVILLGLTWVFAIFAVGRASLVFQYLFSIFNSLQGLFIFIFYCLLKKDVKDIWRQKWTEFTTTASSSDRSNLKSMSLERVVLSAPR
ncbi:hypothetical protein LSH36_221g01028 [Paralvinella palmiformis]|uniref:G-protein coupled receptors family 2 profile 2 domain-containing protein n=1 Tax=Paralvinella palmiformis TaxID=53620 RepID=A0AAD9JMT7_9ANNE|nr:hypothetical protein LSH36_221g01028 [Paralvinella palmiformis]